MVHRVFWLPFWVLLAMWANLAHGGQPKGIAVRGAAHLEGKAERITVRVWGLGEAVVRDARLLSSPLAETTVTPGGSFQLGLPEAAGLPVQVEVSAPDHVAVCLDVLFPSQAPLPPAWLPRGERLEIAVRRGGTSAPQALIWGRAWDTFQDYPPFGRYYPCVPRAAAPAGQRQVWVPAQATVVVAGRDEDGAWGSWEGMGGRVRVATLQLDSVAAVVRVIDRMGQPVAGARVAAGDGPLGTGVVTDEEGRATVQVRAKREWSLVALAPRWAARSVRRGPPPAEVLDLELTPREDLDLRWRGPREVAALPSWLPSALTGGAATVVGGGRAHLPLVGAPRGGLGFVGSQILLWAPGFEEYRASVEGGGEAAEVELKPASALAVRVSEGSGVPRAGVPVWAWVPPQLPGSVMVRMPFAQPPARRLLPEGVTDSKGTALLGEMPTGKVRVSARAPGFPEARSEELELAAGQRHEVTLTLTRGVSLACTVTDTAEVALEGALVEVFRRRETRGGLRFSLGGRDKPLEDLAGSATTDGKGRATIANLAPGPVQVWVSLPGFATRRVDAELSEKGGEVGPIVLAAGVTLRGRVVDERGDGVPSATIFSGPPGAPILVDVLAQSDGDGYFTVPDLPDEEVLVLQARAARHVASLPTRVSMPPADLVVLQVSRGRTLTGRVVDEDSAEPVAGAMVGASQRLQRSMGGATMIGMGRTATGAETDEKGTFLLEGLPPGEAITVLVRAAGYQPQSLDIDLAERDEHALLTITLQRGLVIAGRVVDEAGAPRPGVQVECTAATMTTGGELMGFVPPTTTSAEGRFRFEGVGAGQWQVVARNDEGATAREVVEAGRDDVVLRLTLPGSLRGRVVGEDGAPLAGAEVRLLGAREGKQATADGLGAFHLTGLAPGGAQVTAVAKGWAPDRKQVTIEAGRTAQVELMLKRGGAVVGRVLGLSAAELGRCQVSAGGATATPDASGAFRLEGVATGSQVVRAMVLPDFKVRQATVNVPAPGAEVEVELDFAAGLRLAGKVRRGTRPAAGVTVVAGLLHGMGSSSTVTDAAGAWSLAGFSEGEHMVQVVSEQGQVVVQRRITLTGDTTLDLEIPAGSLGGRVIGGARREGIAGALVRIEHEGQEIRGLTTDESGAFIARELADGTYRLRASAPGWSPAEAEGAVSMGVGRAVTLELKEEQALLLRLREADGTVPDRVNLIAARGGRVEESMWVACDRQGRLRVSTLPRGEYVLLLQGLGQALLRAPVPSAETLVTLAPAGTLALTSAKGVTGAWRARVITPELGTFVPVNPWLSPTRDGWVSVEGRTTLRLPAGRYLVEWVSPQGEMGSAPVEVPREGVATLMLGE